MDRDTHRHTRMDTTNNNTLLDYFASMSDTHGKKIEHHCYTEYNNPSGFSGLPDGICFGRISQQPSNKATDSLLPKQYVKHHHASKRLVPSFYGDKVYRKSGKLLPLKGF